jgi:HD-like signal output (HDOD) protein/ActR/RegA family two-component response regulator
MNRILIVDDEPRNLVALQLMLASKRSEWDIRVAAGGEAALVALDGATFDAVVCDLLMPRMDGTAVLEAVRRQQPGAIRIILSDAADIAASARAMHIAHQFLAKPCTSGVLTEALSRAFRVQRQLGAADLHELVCGVTALPSPPRVFQTLTAAMANAEVDMAVVVQTVSQEVGLSAKVLQLVNSSCFGLGRQLVDLREAVTYLGLRTLKQLVLGAEVFGGAETARLATECNLLEEQEHAVTIARIAAEIVTPEAQFTDAAFTAALLHDVGELVLAGHLPDAYRRTKAAVRTRRSGGTATPGDIRLLDLHARVGGYLAGVWGLPDVVVDAILHHHQPARCTAEGLHLAGIVHVADCLHEFLRTGGEQEAKLVFERLLDREWLEAAGCADRIDDWCERTLALGAELAAGAPVG